MIQKEDVLNIAKSLKITLTESQVDLVIKECNDRGESDIWYAIIEDSIYNITKG